LSRFIFIACIIILIALAIIQAPAFVIVSDPPVKSDAVVLFIGNDRGTREKEANQLMQEGFAEYLIIPARSQVKKLNPDGTLSKIDLNLKLNNLKLNTSAWLEDTHQEALIAHEIMERLGLRSAILVSSPYHMRRIKLIAERVFGDRTALCYAPTRYETPTEGFWLLNNHEVRHVLMEYLKIIWFLLYSPFV